MGNEYRQSLETWKSIQGTYEKLGGYFDRDEVPPEDEMITFLVRLNRAWPTMYAIEQRHGARHMRTHVCNWVNAIYRISSGRSPAMGGAFGVEGSFDLNEFLDERVHEGKPIFTLRRLEKMADAVDRGSSQQE